MKMERYFPADILRPYIRAFLIIESEDGMENRILPDTSLVMAFRYKGNISFAEEGRLTALPGLAITGVRKSSRRMNYERDTGAVLAIFQEGGAAAFLKEPLHELYNKSLGLDDLIQRRKLAVIEEQLAAAKDHLQRIALIEKFLVAQLATTQQDLLVHHAVEKIRLANGDISIKHLLTDIPLSRDPFEKRFRRVTGTSPKQFAAIIRLRHLIDNYSPRHNLTSAAYAAGYFDQSHFIRDFRSFTGQSPKEFFAAPFYW